MYLISMERPNLGTWRSRTAKLLPEHKGCLRILMRGRGSTSPAGLCLDVEDAEIYI